MPEGLSNTAFAKLIGVTEGAVRKADKQGRIKRLADGSIDEALSLKLWREQSDPARTVARTAPRTGTSTGGAEVRSQIGTFPAPDAYRARSDLPDAFVQGALFGAHLVAFGIPTVVGCAAIEAGLSREVGLALHDAARIDAAFLVGGVCEDLGLIAPDAELPAVYQPAAFQGFDPRPLTPGAFA
ncbi:hypothetical protein [Methylobacterium sp. CCH5-D2]|uniref:hypothetical protein n=1 Tax=Methylobacterium sp. CCH5-D2 TaxID=1768765 RepID=UPI00082FB406|nr:hypothetical protein [Methylobacterium sp. CCH5-D2]